MVENKNPIFWPEILKIVFETADFVEILILFLKISVGNQKIDVYMAYFDIFFIFHHCIPHRFP